MLTKDRVKELVEHMPDTFFVDDIVEEIILLQKIERTRQQVKDGNFLTEEEWIKKLIRGNKYCLFSYAKLNLYVNPHYLCKFDKRQKHGN